MSYCIPWLVALTFLSADGTSFTSKEGNYKLTYPSTWRTFKSPEEMFQLALRRGADVIMVSALETPATIEDLLDSLDEGAKFIEAEAKEVDRKDVQVGGARAVRVELEARPTGVKLQMFLTVFTHQGIAYRLMGIRVFGDAKQFEKDYTAVVDSFAFLADRAEWLAKFQGKPAPSALLGGLAAFELNRPRWREATFDRGREYGALDHAVYDFFPSGAWVFVSVREARGDAAAELEEQRDTLSARFQKVTTTERVDKGHKVDIPSVEIAGQQEQVKFLIRATALVEDGLAAHVWMECVWSQRETTRPDWEQLLRSFRLQARSKPAEPPAYPLPRPPDAGRADPGLAVFLAKARRVADDPMRHGAAAFSPDGSRMLAPSADGIVVRHLTANRLERVPAEGSLGMPLAWSRDGRQIAIDTGEEVKVLSLDTKETRKIAADADHAAFTPGGDQLLLCVRDGDPARRRFTTSRLEAVNLEDGSRRTLVEFPLSQVSLPAVSPDGKRLALVTNRDAPRTSPHDGHLYVAAADGSGLRQLTKDPEHIISVAWSPDRAWLYVVRRLAVGERGRVGIGGPSDLYRVSPETGAAVNLTRSGKIARVWCAGRNLLLETQGWDVSPAQRGIFRIAAEELEQATTARPAPPVFDPAAHRAALTAAVRQALGGADVKGVVPTPALLEKVARAYAEAAAARCGVPLDFGLASLDRAADLFAALDRDDGADRLLRLGAGAYHGETLRKAASAEWTIKPVPFGDWIPGRFSPGNALVHVVFPFSHVHRDDAILDDGLPGDLDDDLPPRTFSSRLPREQGRKLILVYPPAHAADALREATGPDYEKALELADKGEVPAAVDLLLRELLRQPKNRGLAREALALCEAARLPTLADELTRKAVEAGGEAPELLLRYAEAVARDDAKKALGYLQRAAQGEGVPAGVFIQLGKAYAAGGRPGVAESCWRRAYWQAAPAEQAEIRKLMGLPEPPQESKLTRFPGR